MFGFVADEIVASPRWSCFVGFQRLSSSFGVLNGSSLASFHTSVRSEQVFDCVGVDSCGELTLASYQVVNHGHVGDGLRKKAPMYFSLHLRPYIFISRAAKVRKKGFLHMLLRHFKKHKANKRLRVFELYPNVKLRSNKCLKTFYLLSIFDDGGLRVAKVIYIFSCRLEKKTKHGN